MSTPSNFQNLAAQFREKGIKPSDVQAYIGQQKLSGDLLKNASWQEIQDLPSISFNMGNKDLLSAAGLDPSKFTVDTREVESNNPNRAPQQQSFVTAPGYSLGRAQIGEDIGYFLRDNAGKIVSNDIYKEVDTSTADMIKGATLIGGAFLGAGLATGTLSGGSAALGAAGKGAAANAAISALTGGDINAILKSAAIGGLSAGAGAGVAGAAGLTGAGALATAGAVGGTVGGVLRGADPSAILRGGVTGAVPGLVGLAAPGMNAASSAGVSAALSAMINSKDPKVAALAAILGKTIGGNNNVVSSAATAWLRQQLTPQPTTVKRP